MSAPVSITVSTPRNAVASALLLILSPIGSGALTLLFLLLLTRTNFPAFGNSNFVRSLTTVGQVVMLLATFCSMAFAYYYRVRLQRGDPITYWRAHFWPGLIGSWSAAGLVTVSLGLPLAATKLYLHGITGDQAFRTEYLTRLTDNPMLHDMAYINTPPYYPSSWFWLGGRFANLMNLPGWEAFKPWSIISLALTAAFVTAIWTLIIRPDVGIFLGATTALVVTAYGSPEPYAGCIAMLIPVIFTLGWHAISPYPGSTNKGITALIACIIFLGISAATYTLYTALPAVTLIGMALITTGTRLWAHRTHPQGALYILRPLIRLAIIGVGSCLIALLHWGNYLIGGFHHPTSSSGSALHYLPAASSTLMLPMFKTDAIGFLCLIGLIWIIVTIRQRRLAQAFAYGIIAMYLWTIVSMSSVVFGVTLLGFRLALPLTLTFALAGACGVVDATYGLISLAVRYLTTTPSPDGNDTTLPLVRGGYTTDTVTTLAATDAPTATADTTTSPRRRKTVPISFTSVDPDPRPSFSSRNYGPHTRRTSLTIMAVVSTIFMFIGIGFAQNIPGILSSEIQMAYVDTDGDGVRADRFPAGIPSYYPQVNQVLMNSTATAHGHPGTPSDIILLTTEEALLAYYPFWAFQAISPHYANPLGLYDERNNLIEKWALATSPADLLHQLDNSPFPAPTAFVFRREGDNYSLLLSEDVYPNQPNVHDYLLSFPPRLFQHRCFHVKDVGPLTVVTRMCTPTGHY